MPARENCPDCDGTDSVTVYTWANGATTKECDACGWFDFIPPAPSVS